MAKVVGIIPIRYASKRFPGKALALIKGKTLIERTYQNAKKCFLLDKIVIATDHKEIFDHAKTFCPNVLMTKDSHQNGTERIAEVLSIEPDFQKADVIVNIQGDEPIIDPKTIEKVATSLLEDKHAEMATAAFPITDKNSIDDPSLVKCVFDKNGYALYFSRRVIPYNGNQYFGHIGLYAYKPSFIHQYITLNPTPLQLAEDLEQLKVLEHGYKIKIAIVSHASKGVDTPKDIKIVENQL